MVILLAGGAGYIGSHTAISLIENGQDIVIIDDLSNSHRSAVEGIKTITHKDVKFYEMDINNISDLRGVFKENDIDCVINFAGLKSLADSLENPLEYYYINLNTTLNLLKVMEEHDVKRFVFSSSAIVYGDELQAPYTEDMLPEAFESPYAKTKAMTESILEDIYAVKEDMSIVILRYFNPIGAHESALIGEEPKGTPNNLLPYIIDVAAGDKEELVVFGSDYDTPDGSPLRDYIHVMDLAEGHTKAVAYSQRCNGIEYFNLGSGKPYSVLEVISAFEETNQIKVPYRIGEKRTGDIGESWADIKKAKKMLAWSPRYDINCMCRDAWNYYQKTLKKRRKHQEK